MGNCRWRWSGRGRWTDRPGDRCLPPFEGREEAAFESFGGVAPTRLAEDGFVEVGARPVVLGEPASAAVFLARNRVEARRAASLFAVASVRAMQRRRIRLLTWNALAASVGLAVYGLFTPDTSHPLIIGVLLFAGCLRSLQFTSMNAIAYDEVAPSHMAQASSVAGMMQQLSLSVGVAIGGYALQFAAVATGREVTAPENFSFAFFIVGGLSALSAAVMWRLPRHAGAEMAGRAGPGEELSEPKAAQRPVT
jgi:hypothetical protein